MIMVVYRHTPARKIYMAKPDQSEWVPTSLCKNLSRSSTKESTPFLNFLTFIWDVIIDFDLYTQYVLTGVLSGVYGYDYNLEMISPNICTRQRCLTICHWFTVSFLVPFFCVWNIGKTLYIMWTRPLQCLISRIFLLKMIYHLCMMHVCFAFPLGVVEYSHGRIPKNKYPSMIWPMDMLRWELYFLYM